MIYTPQDASSLNDFFLPRNQRAGKNVFCYRINGYSPEIRVFLEQYYQLATTAGFVQLGKIPNPNEGNLTFYHEMIGEEFQLEVAFLSEKLKKWLPRLTEEQNQIISTAMFETLVDLQSLGKNLNILKNIYTKFMCWMYYRFERLLRQLGAEQVPKILYEGSISDYELRLISVCSKAGCDVILLQYEGDTLYLKVDGKDLCTKPYNASGLQPFPTGFSLDKLRAESQQKANLQQMYPEMTTIKVVVNGFQPKKTFTDLPTTSEMRGGGGEEIYTCNRALIGVEDKVSYLSEVYRLHQEMQAESRTVLLLDQLQPPTPDEIAKIPRDNYQTTEQMLKHLLRNISCPKYPQLERLMGKAFLDVLLGDETFQGNQLNKQSTQGIYLLCWLKRYQESLWKDWSKEKLPCVFVLHGAENDSELLFYNFLSQLPLDLCVLAPDLDKKKKYPLCAIKEEYANTFQLERFPTEPGEVQIGTMAYHAERDLDGMMYTDSGMFRNQQFQKASPVVLKTMYEEIAILWDQELKFRPDFNTLQDTVYLPVLFAKVSGIVDGNVSNYWSGIKKLCTPETLVISAPPYIRNQGENPMKGIAPQFYKNGKLQKNEIKNHSSFPYHFLRQETQDYMLEKLELMLAGKNIKGMGSNGMEYTVIATVLHLENEIVRMIQGFDFTKKNPKIIYVHTTEAVPSIDDAILLAFLSLLGFDILVFVPTGYQGIEIHYNRSPLIEHQIGTYLYDLQVPKLGKQQNLSTWGKNLFRRGGT